MWNKCKSKLKQIRAFIFKTININKEKFECPICNYLGPFLDINPEWGFRKNAKCPNCSSLERHRLLYLVIEKNM